MTKQTEKPVPAQPAAKAKSKADGALPDAALDQVSGGTEMLSNVSKTRSEISMTFARNARA